MAHDKDLGAHRCVVNDNIPAYAIFHTRKVGVTGKRKDARMATKKPPARKDEIARLSDELKLLRSDLHDLRSRVRKDQSWLYDKIVQVKTRPSHDPTDTENAFLAGLVIGVGATFALFGFIFLCS